MERPATVYYYEGCSESNVFYFITLVHDIRGGCWWDDSGGWTVPPIFHYMLLLCERRQQKGSLTEWCLTWKCVSSKGVTVNISMQKKNGSLWHSSTLTEHLWGPNSECVHNEVVHSKHWRHQYERQAMFQMAMHTCHVMKWISSRSAHLQGIGISGNCVQCWTSASVCWKQWWQCWNITKFVPGWSHECLHGKGKHCMQVCQKLLSQYKAEGSGFLDCIVTGEEMWCHLFELESKQQSKEWQHVNSPLKKKFKMQPSEGIINGAVFWDKEGVILINFLKLWQSALTATLQYWLSWRPEKKIIFLLQYDNTRLHSSFMTMEHTAILGWTVLLHPPDLVPSNFLFSSLMKGGLCGQCFPSSDAVIAAVK